jgi:hypothetical protein
LSRGLNRGLGTITAGGLAIAVALLATHLGQLEKLILIVSTFVVGKSWALLTNFLSGVIFSDCK